jgi:hypothetical protein
VVMCSRATSTGFTACAFRSPSNDPAISICAHKVDPTRVSMQQGMTASIIDLQYLYSGDPEFVRHVILRRSTVPEPRGRQTRSAR